MWDTREIPSSFRFDRRGRLVFGNEHILYDGVAFATFAAVAPDLRHRTLTVNGLSKAYATTGWRIGYGGGPAPLIRAMTVVQSQSTSCPSSVSQASAVEALNGPQEHRRGTAARRKFDAIVRVALGVRAASSG